MRVTILVFIFLIGNPFLQLDNGLLAQPDDSIYVAYFKRDIEIVDPNYKRNYNYMLRKVKRVYPYALYAKELLENYEADISEIEKKRQIKKYGKTAHEKLMDDFEYVIRDMYVSDGKILMKLVYRETGISVYDIIAKYRGKMKAGWYSTVGKMFEQDLKAAYQPDKEDWLIERIVKEIEAGKHKLDELKLLSKEEFLEIKKSDKEKAKKAAEVRKERERLKKETEKALKKAAKEKGK